MIKFARLFIQVLHWFPCSEFAALVKKHNVERHAKGFTSWSHFVAVFFCRLAGADPLCVIANGLKCCLGKLRPSASAEQLLR